MSFFGAPLPPTGGVPTSSVTPHIFPGNVGSVFSTSSDNIKQQQQQQSGFNFPPKPPVFQSTAHSGISGGFPTTTSASNHQNNSFNSGKGIFSKSSEPPPYFAPNNNNNNNNNTINNTKLSTAPSLLSSVLPSSNSTLNTPVFGAASTFVSTTTPPPSNISGIFSKKNNNNITTSGSGGGSSLNSPIPSSVFSSSTFHHTTHTSESPNTSTIPTLSSITSSMKVQPQTSSSSSSSVFGVLKNSTTWKSVSNLQSQQLQQLQIPTQPPPVYSKHIQNTPPFNPMNTTSKMAVAKRGRGGSILVGGRGAGRGEISQIQQNLQIQQQQQNYKKQNIISPTSVISGEQLLSTRVFIGFMQKIMDDDEAKREDAADFLDNAFFGVVGSHVGGRSDFSTILQQMLSAWRTLKESQQQQQQQEFFLKGDHWVALFAIGCHLNFVSSTILAGNSEREKDITGQRSIILDNKWAVLTNSCTYANLLCDICLQLMSNQSENHVPYSVVPLILRRARNIFELANDEGVSTVQPNIRAIILKLHRYVQIPCLQREPQSIVERQRANAFACVLGEMLVQSCAPNESNKFIQSFHQYCSEMVEIRSTLYHHYAHNLLQEPLSDLVIREAMKLLAQAFVIIPDDAKENKRIIFVKLTACGLALGQIPSLEYQKNYNITELEDLIVSIRSCNLKLFNLAMRNYSEFYVQCGIHNVLQFIDKRISLLMVVKYYMNKSTSHLPVQDMINYYKLPFTIQEACYVWLLPLLVEKRINGVMESGVLILSGSNPFDDYSKNALEEVKINE